MKISSMMCAVSVMAFAASGAFADPSINYNASKSNTGSMTAQPTTTCPTGQTWDAAAKKCIAAPNNSMMMMRSNTTHNSMMSATHTCPTGQSWDAASGKCAATDMAVKGTGVPQNASTMAPATTTTPSPTH